MQMVYCHTDIHSLWKLLSEEELQESQRSQFGILCHGAGAGKPLALLLPHSHRVIENMLMTCECSHRQTQLRTVHDDDGHV